MNMVFRYLHMPITTYGIFLVVALLTLSSCGEKRELTHLTESPEPVITVQDTFVVTIGSFVGETEAVVKQFAPIKVMLNTKIEDLGNHKFILKTEWTYEGAEPQYWSVDRYEDRNDGSDEFVKNGNSVIRRGEKLEDQSMELEGNRKYRFVLVAHVYEAFNKPPASGSVKYKTILVNLKGL